jgi:hypothetical protein
MTTIRDLIIETRGKIVSEQELDGFLDQKRIAISPLFREFLLMYSGSVVQKRSFKERYSFDMFVALTSQRAASIEQLMEGYRIDWQTTEWFPFAIDSGGWVFSLSLAGKRAGQVWLDQYGMGLKNPFKLVATSFEEFIDGLEPYILKD